MEQQYRFSPSHFIQLYDEFNIEIRNPTIRISRQSQTGITNTGRFYSVEILFEMLLTISATYGRLAYKQEQFANEGILSAVFKKLSIGFIDMANSSYHVANEDNIIRFTDLAAKNIECLKEFEDANNITG